MKAKHTPGPWRYVQDDPSDQDYGIYAGDIDFKHTLIGEVFGSVNGKGGFEERSIPLMEEAEANTYLIAAAPELLEFAIDMMKRYPNSQHIYGPARAIIEKATL